jgi:hypothetical protein
VVFLCALVFEILSLDSKAAATTEAAIQLVVVPIAVRLVIEDVECGG